MALYELEHPLGRDIEKIHQAMMAGFDERKDLLCESSDFNFVDALSTGRGVSVLVIASWATKNHTMIEIPVVVEPNDPEWLLPLEDAEPVSVFQRITIKDMMGRGFGINNKRNEPKVFSDCLIFNVTRAGIFLGFETNIPLSARFGEYESEIYDNYDRWARNHGNIGELAILADVV